MSKKPKQRKTKKDDALLMQDAFYQFIRQMLGPPLPGSLEYEALRRGFFAGWKTRYSKVSKT